MKKTYTELIGFDKYIDRFNYLKIQGRVGEVTFGYDRYLNQVFYSSPEWKQLRDYIISRDMGRDMAFEGYEIHGTIYIHHINPITLKDIDERSPELLNPENLVCVSFYTHQAIHYSDDSLLIKDPVIRKPNDTCPWKK